MKTSEFDYDLSPDQIAEHPLADKEKCNMEIVDRHTRMIEHREFSDVIEYLNAEDVLVLNDTRVIPARLYASSQNRDDIEILLLEKKDEYHWSCLMKKPKDGLEIIFQDDLKAVIQKENNGQIILRFNAEIDDYLNDHGFMPLPPYIQRRPEQSDRDDYQTVYAKYEGSVAAPTAGLHFSESLLKKVEDLGVYIEYVTLHVGYGTFRPVKSEDVRDHKMHSEYYELSDKTAKAVNKARQNSNKVIAVGTTSLRTLESCVDDDGELKASKGSTDLFIYPGYEFKAVDSLITNFHMPRSTLFMLVCAFGGKELMMQAYERAKQNGYRFLSYGDAMIII